jgi:organic hydroperoxide reductase OsmC/OhrA
VTPTHLYRATIRWTGDLGSGTSDYRAYSRDHDIDLPGKPTIHASSGLSPGSRPDRVNPDELLVASLASCHMLWYLHLASEAGVVVTSYEDHAEGTLELVRDTGGRFIEAVLHPEVVLSSGEPARALALHAEAHRKCFIANSVNFPVRYEPTIRTSPASAGSH